MEKAAEASLTTLLKFRPAARGVFDMDFFLARTVEQPLSLGLAQLFPGLVEIHAEVLEHRHDPLQPP